MRRWFFNGRHGNPSQRNPEAVIEDVREECYTPEYARDVYGVVLTKDLLALDKNATEELRARLATELNGGDKPAYLRHFHDRLDIDEFRPVNDRKMKC